MKFFQLTPLQVAVKLNTDLTKGLTSKQVQINRELYSSGLTGDRDRFTKSGVVAEFKELSTVALLVSALVSLIFVFLQQDVVALVGAVLTALFVLIVVMARVFLVRKVNASMRDMFCSATFRANVVRDGKSTVVAADHLVPGDIVFLSAGDRVPADGRIVHCSLLKVDESYLLGESLPSEKNDAVIHGDNHAPAELHNMLFGGSLILRGEACVIITSIGEEMLRNKLPISQTSNPLSFQSRLQFQMSQISKLLSLFALIIGALVFVLGLLRKGAFADTLLLAASMVFAISSVSLEILVSVTLAVGSKTLYNEKIRIKNQSVIEKLASVQVICTDKTGTLTKNDMSVKMCYAKDELFPFQKGHYANAAELILYGSMCCDVKSSIVDGKRVFDGDPTECGIVRALETIGKKHSFVETQFPLEGRLPFDKIRKCTSSIRVINGHNLVIVKGTPDILLSLCCDDKEIILKANKAVESMAKQGLRVLGIAVKEIETIPPELFVEDIEANLTFIGLIGLKDSLRADATSSLATGKNAGIKTIMMTGDHVSAAVAAAKSMGIFKDDSIALTAGELDELSEQQLEGLVEHCCVYSGVSSKQKLRFLKVWQKKKYSVAFSGETVDDVPLLQNADVGYTYAHAASDVARVFADVILEENHFSMLARAIHLSRASYNNVLKAIRFFLAGNLSIVLAALLTILFGGAFAFTPLQLLLLCVLTVIVPSYVFGYEAARDGLMNAPPRDQKKSLLNTTHFIEILWHGVSVSLVTVAAFFIGKNAADFSSAKTMAFVVFAAAQLLHAYSMRSVHPLLKIGLFKNKKLNIVCIAGTVLILVTLFVPAVNTLFGNAALTWLQWLLVLILSVVPLLFFELLKTFKKIKR